ncbi:M13 family metallopeptidase [Falsihalocynthiibacter sp. SS001]|uniref:M13 family metallopeptidase n=1 Tax=Falsihalocynthiibacter sp. SS001 TaxID=3349698 RepID=UPI0036D3EE20
MRRCLYPSLSIIALGTIVSAACAEELQPIGPDDLAFSVENMDQSVDPAEDFYRYASGAWQDRITRPSHLSAYGMFDIMQERQTQQMKLTVARAGEAAATAPKGSPTQLVGDFYNAYMDVERIDAAGIEPIRDLLDKIAELENLDDLLRFSAELAMSDGPAMLVAFLPFPDLADSKKYAVYGQGGSLGIDEQFHSLLREGPDGERYVAYKTYIEEILDIAGYEAEDAQRIAETTLEIETEILAAMLSPEEGIDPHNFYNPMPFVDAQAEIPNFDLPIYFETLGIDVPENVILSEPRLFPVLNKMLAERPLQDFQDYATFRVIDSYRPQLTTEFDEPSRVFDEVLTGVGVLLPREDRALEELKVALGHPLSQVYVDNFYPEEIRTKATDMVDRIYETFMKRIPSLDWLSDETRAAAQEKLEKFTIRIGYPDNWIDYSSVDIGPDVVDNMRNIAAFDVKRYFERASGPVVQEEFNSESTLPIVVNAAYNALMNGFEVPAAIQQAPAFDADMDAPIYFCRLGAIIGHEMTHGFDSGGRQFDADGNLRDWWTEKDAEAFNKRAEKLVDQANAVEILPGLYLNGPLNVKENMADVGGVSLAHAALMEHLEEHPEENVEIDGLSPSQRCFLSWAQLWTWKASEQFIRTIVASDGHPPSEYRTYAPLQHLDAFYEAFDINEGDPMWLAPEQRVSAW